MLKIKASVVVAFADVMLDVRGGLSLVQLTVHFATHSRHIECCIAGVQPFVRPK
jgi:hypothetical protein